MFRATVFVDAVAVAFAAPRVPSASFVNGANPAGSNSPGLGINIDGGALPDIDAPGAQGYNWTLLDQFGNSRAGQIGQLIGGNGVVIRAGDNPSTWDPSQPSYSPAGAASSGGTEGTAPDNEIKLGTNPDNVNGAPDPDGEVTIGGPATLDALASGWVIPV